MREGRREKTNEKEHEQSSFFLLLCIMLVHKLNKLTSTSASAVMFTWINHS